MSQYKPTTEMTNDEIFAEMQRVVDKINEFFSANNLKERNALVPRFRELSRAYDWGFKVGELVETKVWQGRWQEAKITEYDNVENLYYVRNDIGWEIGVDGRLLRKIVEAKVEPVVHVKISPPDPAEEFEQMELALF